MTGTDVFAIEKFESKLNRLKEAYAQAMAENAMLRTQLSLQSAELTKAHEQYAKLSQSYSDLKLTKIINASDSEREETQRRLLKLVRDVDRCIALLNASEQKDDKL